MTKARLLALALVLAAVTGVVAWSRLASSDAPASSGTSAASRPLSEPGAVDAAGPLDTDGIIAFWRERVERDPRDYISATELAGAFLRRARETGDVASYAQAQTALDQALALNPSYSAAITYLATLRYSQHDFREALRLAERVYASDPGSKQALATIGDASLELGEYERADAAYTDLLAVSETAPVYSRIARLRELQGRPGEAIDLLERGVDQAIDSSATGESIAFYLSQLGATHFNAGDLDAAQDAYDRSLDAFPDYVHGLAGLGRVAAARGDFDAAIDSYRRVVERYPLVEYVIALGDVYAASGDRDLASRQYALVDAIDRLYRANGINTDLQMALYLADHPSRAGRTGDAVAQARAAYEERPGIHAADALAWALYKSGRLNVEEARRYSGEALRLGTQDALLLFHAGTIAQAAGDADEGRALIARAVEINPKFSLLYADEAQAALAAVMGEPNPRPH